VAAAASGNFADRAEAIFRSRPRGVGPSELGSLLYGADDKRGSHKARAVVHFLQHRRNVPIGKTFDGKWALVASPDQTDSGPLYNGATAPNTKAVVK
jgi:hypothetical protein